MPEWTVTWTIEVDGDDPEEAAREALAIQHDPESIANVFHVRRCGDDSDTVLVDLDKLDDPDSVVQYNVHRSGSLERVTGPLDSYADAVRWAERLQADTGDHHYVHAWTV